MLFKDQLLKEILTFLSYVVEFRTLFLEPNPRHMEIPRLGVESELQMLAYTTATATPDP